MKRNFTVSYGRILAGLLVCLMCSGCFLTLKADADGASIGVSWQDIKSWTTEHFEPKSCPVGD